MWMGYYDHLPAEEDNPWMDAPTDAEIEAITKDEYKKGPGRADNRPGRKEIHIPILTQRSGAK